MSRRQVTTLSVEVRLRTPPGSNTAEVLTFIRNALEEAKSVGHSLAPANPVYTVDTKEMIVKLLKKETVYL